MKRIIVSLSLIIGLALALQTVLFAESDWKIIRQADWETSFNDVYFVDGYNGWAVGNNGVIAHTKDRGETWCSQNSGGNEGLNSVDFVNANEGWIAGDVILHTNDAGENWVVQYYPETRLYNVDFVNANEGWVVGDYGIILHTNDGGTTWTPQDSGVEIWLSAVFFASPQDGWAVGGNGTILHTNNGGDDWEAQTSNTTETLRDVHFVSTDEGWAVGDNGVILHTSNGGTEWIFQDSGTTRKLCDVHFVSATEGWAMSLFFNILYTSDGGATWYQLNGQTFMGCSPFFLETHNPKTHFIDSSEGWVVTSHGHIFHTVDGGNTWTYQIDTPGSTLYSIDFVNPVKGWAVDVVLHTGNSGVNWTIQHHYLGHVGLDFVSPDEGWIVGEDIWYTSNGGISWEEQYDTQFNEKYPLYDVHFVNLTSGWVVGNDGTILHTDDGGENWIEQDSGVSSQLRGVAFANGSKGWVVGDNGVILHTSDGGENWEQQLSGTSNSLSGLSFVSDTEGWVVGENIILHTDDGGTTWTPQAEGYPLRNVVFVNKNEGWAVGNGGVILHTDDGGATWTQQDSGTDNNLNGICYDGYSSLYVVGDWGIVLRYIDPMLSRTLIGDVSGNGTISAYDAALILQYTVGLIDRFPAEIITSPSEVMPRDYAVSLPSLTAKAGDRIQIPIRINDATGLFAGGISVKYNSTILRAIDVAISPWASGVYWRANTELDGEVRVAFAGAKPLEGKGNLFHVTYEVLPNAEGVTTPLILDNVQLSNSLNIATVNGWITVLPSRSMLFQNYPNPFNPETWIPFQLAQDATVKVNIYNSKGQLIRRLNLGQKHAGSYITKARAAYWNGQDEHGNHVASGLYFYSLQAGDFTATRKMVILK
jgi:photosystem II stability/assembly factor-like uncharacterized protein